MAGTRDLRLEIADGDGTGTREARFAELPTVFDRLREAGHDAALTGWYHPYCRILGDALVDCRSTGAPIVGRVPDRLGDALVEQFRRMSHGVPLVKRLTGRNWLVGDGWRGELRRVQLESYLVLRERLLAQLDDGTIDVVFAHLPIPHEPGIFDETTGRLSTMGRSGYLGNLVLADRLLGEVRERLARRGDLERTALVVTSDHNWWLKRRGVHRTHALSGEELRLLRAHDHRVPVLVRLPGPGAPLVYDRPFCTAILHDLVLELAAGAIDGPGELACWLGAHAERYPVPAGAYEEAER